MSEEIHGLAAAFTGPEELLTALRRVRRAGYTRVEAYTPFPLEELEELLPGRPSPIPWIMFAAGVIGASGGYFMEWYAAHDYPINVGGRPLHSWPAFVPVTFELMVLTAALVGVMAFFCIARFPRLHHPMFSAAHFSRASQDRFFLCIRAGDPQFDPAATRAFLRDLQPATIEEVPA
ncbi:MAG TPA: DUF3341 domain-containing protein [Opitutaceae bacterium]|nr:DUF3341 domain-containing protein [Opitutaceae bacterium]